MSADPKLPTIKNEKIIEPPQETEKILANQGVPVDPPPQVTTKLPQAPPTNVATDQVTDALGSHIPPSSFPTFATPNTPQPAQSPTTLNPTAPQSPDIKMKEVGKSSKLKIIFAVIIALLLLSGTTTFVLAYTNYQFIPVPKVAQQIIDNVITMTPLPKTPRIILAKTQAQMASLKSANYKTSFDVSTNTKDYPLKNASLTVTGPLEFTETKFPKSSADISGKVTTEGITFSASGSVRLIDKDFYFKLTEVPAGSFLPQLSSIKNQWFVTQLDDIDKVKTIDNDTQIAKIRQVVENYIAKSYKWSTLKSVGDNYELTFKLPKAEITNFVLDLANSVDTNTATITAGDKKSVEEFVDKLEKFEIIVSVDKNSYYIASSKVNFSLNLPPGSTSAQGGISLAPSKPVAVSVKIATELSDYNKPVIVEVPQGAKSLKDYAQQLEKELPKDLNLPNQNLPETTPGAKPTTSNLPVLGDKTMVMQLLILKTFTSFFH